MLDQAFDALKSYDWGKDLKSLKPIEEAVVKTHGNADERKKLETRLAELLKTECSRDAKDYVCRKLMVIGTAACVSTLAELLTDKDLAHMARFALERIQAPEATQALRDALPKTNGAQKIGVISSLGVRRDGASVAALAGLLSGADAAIARAAALALGCIRTADAAKALADAKSMSDTAKGAAVDAHLACAEALMAEGKKAEALAIYKPYAAENQPKHVQVAAKRGMFATPGKRD